MNGFNASNSIYDTPDKLDDNTYDLSNLNGYQAWVQTPQVGPTLNRMIDNSSIYDVPDKLDDGPVQPFIDAPDKVGPSGHGEWNPNPQFNFRDFPSYYSALNNALAALFRPQSPYGQSPTMTFSPGNGSALLDAIFGAGTMDRFLRPQQYNYYPNAPVPPIVDMPDKL